MDPKFPVIKTSIVAKLLRQKRGKLLLMTVFHNYGCLLCSRIPDPENVIERCLVAQIPIFPTVRSLLLEPVRDIIPSSKLLSASLFLEEKCFVDMSDVCQ
jgi:hypothetical protein